MFQRQWHPPGSQLGLTNKSILFENSLLSHDYLKSNLILEDKLRNNPNSYWIRQSHRLHHILARNRNLIKISFEGFWPDFNPQDNQILDYLNLACSDKHPTIRIFPSCDQTDINFVSCYGQNLVIPQNATQVLFLGENVRPNFSVFDYSMGFDKFESCKRIIYFPLWLFEIDFFKKNYNDRKPYPVELFTNPQTNNFIERKNAIVFIGNNAEPFREHILNELIAKGFIVDRFGSHTNPVEDKDKILSQYKFSMCFENSFHPGYVTEKLPHSLLAGCQSIYFGCLTNEPFANHPSIINVNPKNSITALISILNERMINPASQNSIIKPLCGKKELYDLLFKIADQLRNIISIYI